MRSKLIVLAFTFVLGLSSLSIFAQTTNLPGKITVENGEPIPGATIRFKGKSGGVVSKEDGTFTIPSPGKGVLIISSTGYQEKEINVNGLSNVTVTLTKVNQQLDEVVVTPWMQLQLSEETLLKQNYFGIFINSQSGTISSRTFFHL